MAIKKGRWGTGEIGVSDANASSSSRKNRSPRHDGPREAASTVRDAKGGIRTRFSNGTKYPKSSPPALSGERSNADWPRGRRFTDDASAFFTTQTKLQNEYCRGALEYGAPPKRTLIGSPCHRWTAIARAVPSGRPRAFGRARSLARAPGSGSPVFISLNEPSFGEQKTLRSGGSGGFVRHELSISLMRDRSHELGVRNRMAGSHSIVRRGF